MDAMPGPSVPMLPPGGLFEMVFSFDTTGSMSRVIDEVKGRLQDMIQRLQADIPGIRFGVIAHGDYCDRDVFYLEKHIDLTTNIVELTDFVKDVEGTGGGDPEECYEYVLRLTRDLNWTRGSRKALVMIGDSIPHEPDYDLNTDNINWRDETKALADQGVKIYGVQAFEDEKATAFFEEMAAATQGEVIKLSDFSNICDYIMAICYREAGDIYLDDYEAEVRAREARKGLHKDLEGLFGVLRRGDSTASNKSKSSMTSGVDRIAAPLSKLSSLSSVASSVSKTAIVLPVSRPKIQNKAVKKPRADPKKPKESVKSRKINVKPKVQDSKKKIPAYRHKVSDSEFILMQRNLSSRWSPWTLALTNNKNETNSNWIERKDKLGWRKKTLFPKNPCHEKALYEIAVQKSKGCKYNVVYTTWCTLSTIGDNWERKLFKTKLAKECLQTVLKNGGKVFVRRFVKHKMGKVQSRMVTSFNRDNMYKYAWISGLDKPGRLEWAMDLS
ncbi:hypothetical protein ACF0H5_015583 [Mactra antiquata]